MCIGSKPIISISLTHTHTSTSHTLTHSLTHTHTYALALSLSPLSLLHPSCSPHSLSLSLSLYYTLHGTILSFIRLSLGDHSALAHLQTESHQVSARRIRTARNHHLNARSCHLTPSILLKFSCSIKQSALISMLHLSPLSLSLRIPSLSVSSKKRKLLDIGIETLVK